MNRIRKVVIPIAGLGTRMMPVTQFVAKEMLPIGTTPVIRLVIDECERAGITEFVFVTNERKHALNEYLSSLDVDVKFAYQARPMGLGHAILCAKKHVEKEDFAVVLPDELMFCEKINALQQVINYYEKLDGRSVVGVTMVDRAECHKYGIVEPEYFPTTNFMQVSRIVEKPEFGREPSRMALNGRYILSPRIFECLERGVVGVNDEVQLTDAINDLIRSAQVNACEIEGSRYDVGDMVGYIKAQTMWLMRDATYGLDFEQWLKQKLRV